MEQPFPSIRFAGQLRPSQEDVAKIARRKLERGGRRLHIVAPPGSGKTVLGLYLWAECVRRPALVLSPNSAIQAQWAARTELFEFSTDRETAVSTNPQSPALLTSLTYQSVTMPDRGSVHLDEQAYRLWQDRLIETQQAESPEEAQVWIDDLRRHNPDYFDQRMSSWRKAIRDELAISGEALQTLHDGSLATLHRLRDQNVGLIILDECHHLLGHWGRVLADAHELLDGPIVIGLTATPPDRDGKHAEDVQRYDELLGEVDYEVPVPAVVKDGFLAPYQDLAWFVRPSDDELAYVANVDDQLAEILAEVEATAPKQTANPTPASSPPASSPRMRLSEWATTVLGEQRLPTGTVDSWSAFERRDPAFAHAARVYLLDRGIELPVGVPPPELAADASGAETGDQSTAMERVAPVLDRYVRHYLRRSRNKDDHEFAEKIIARLRLLGVQITDTGTRACASPVGRVLAYSESKIDAIVPILTAEHAALGSDLRAVVVADYEKTSAVSAEVEHLLDDEAGGAIAAFKRLLTTAATEPLNPILVTGSSVLVDDDLAESFDTAAQQWLRAEGFEVDLQFSEEDGFHVINGRGSDWCPRVYVEMITELFQRGLTRCLVGTRGLLGEGWDANKINVLIDLTTVTTSMTVNQLRGRSIRLDPNSPHKLANNWDVVCLAPEFQKGLDDYRRFNAKHQTLFGVTDDGAIEKGVGHVHAAFTEIKPEGLEGSAHILNEDMLRRAGRRDHVRDLWKIGQPYSNTPVRAVETRPRGGVGGFPPFAGSKQPWSETSLAAAIGAAVLGALCEANVLRKVRPLRVGQRAGGYVRLFLEEATEEENRIFSDALSQTMGPLKQPRYVIPREIDRSTDTWLSSLLPEIVGKYFRRRSRERVMLHRVPDVLARNKNLAEVFQRHWNRHVSPGEAVYAYRGDGERIVADAIALNQTPNQPVHQKEVFV